ncbi:MAG: hypothetical protein ACREBF_02915 [Candidatus Micrarchaeales archaeon]
MRTILFKVECISNDVVQEIMAHLTQTLGFKEIIQPNEERPVLWGRVGSDREKELYSNLGKLNRDKSNAILKFTVRDQNTAKH